MDARKVILHFVFVISATLATSVIVPSCVLAQADPNIQSRLDTITTPLELTPLVGASVKTISLLKVVADKLPQKYGCVDPKEVVKQAVSTLGPQVLSNVGERQLDSMMTSSEDTTRLLNEVLQNIETIQNKTAAPSIPNGGISPLNSGKMREFNFTLKTPINLCATEQPTSFRASVPFNPTIESNVFRSDDNVHPDQSLGFGGTAQVTTGGWRPYDMVGFSIGSTSLRYRTYAQKDVDSLPIQAAYQFFMGASGYSTSGIPIDIEQPTFKNDLKVIPPSGLVTLNTLAVGFVSQTSFSMPFKAETSELFTPQFTLTRQNISLLGNDSRNICHVKLGDINKDAYCTFLDLSLNVGQTYADQAALQNFNVAVTANFGRRFEDSNWNIALQTTLTERCYEDVTGGRDDFQLQIGPSFSYAGTIEALRNAPFTFALPVTYTENLSSVQKDTWHGVVVVPTFTIAFESALK